MKIENINQNIQEIYLKTLISQEEMALEKL